MRKHRKRSGKSPASTYEEETVGDDVTVMEPPIKKRNLALEGGGVKGIALCGRIKLLRSEGKLQYVKNYAGTSVGAIIAGLMACGASDDFLYKEIYGLDFESFKDDSWGFIADVYRLYYDKGWYKGDAMFEVLGRILNDLCGDPNITFQQVYDRFGSELAMFATAIYVENGQRKMRRVDIHRHKYPDMPIRVGQRMSASFPLFFAAVQFEGVDVADGGIIYNYPVNWWDVNCKPNMETIGIRLMTGSEYQQATGQAPSDSPKRIANVKEYVGAIIDGLYTKAQQAHERRGDWERTEGVNTGDISAMDLSINDEQKTWLYNQGLVRAAVIRTDNLDLQFKG